MLLRATAWHLGPPSRRLRLAAGLVLLTYVTLHLIDHALLLVSLAAADRLLVAQKFLWRGVLGTLLLYGAALTHAALGLHAAYARRSFARPVQEPLQLLLGLTVPALIANHIAVTRLAYTLHGLDKAYTQELFALWVAEPFWGWIQAALLVVAWTHAMVGLAALLRLRPWWHRARPALLSVSLLLPILALLGFSEGGRLLARLAANPGFHAAFLAPGQLGTAAQKSHLAAIRRTALLVYLALLGLVLLARAARTLADRRRRHVTIAYPDGTRVRVPAGHSVLEASRQGGIAHASICGGRGRCSTCRIRVLGPARLPDPAPHERRVLDAIGADPASIRLACQLRPHSDLAVMPLIPPGFAPSYLLGTPRWPEQERFVAALFVDLRESSSLAANRMPFDTLFLLGSFLTEAGRAITNAGGHPVQFLGDGLLALFGLDEAPAEACRSALAAVDGIAHATRRSAPLFAQEAGRILGYGIGLACGQALVGEIAFHAAEPAVRNTTPSLTAIGETIILAHRLQDLARDEGATAAIAEPVFQIANLAPRGQPLIRTLRGQPAPTALRLL